MTSKQVLYYTIFLAWFTGINTIVFVINVVNGNVLGTIAGIVSIGGGIWFLGQFIPILDRITTVLDEVIDEVEVDDEQA